MHDLDPRWHAYFFSLAERSAAMSKDPSTKVGAVISRPDRTVCSLGWNGFPRGVSDHPDHYADREYKAAVVVHAEENAILSAREPLQGYTIHVSGLPPCARCASLIIQSGLKRVVILNLPIPERWRTSAAISRINLLAAGVRVQSYNPHRGMMADTIDNHWAQSCCPDLGAAA